MYQMHSHDIRNFETFLRQHERSEATVRKYTRDLERFFLWLPEKKPVDKSTVIRYKEQLCGNHSPSGVNVVLAALNGFFRFMGWQDCLVRALHIQRRVFSAPEQELTRCEYMSLVKVARKQKNLRLELLLQLMASTGIRVSEIRYVTAEAVAQNRVQIRLKGKIRTILLPGKLCHRLRKYQSKQGISAGPLFLSQSGAPLDRRDIWRQMKRLSESAGVAPGKVFPHNLRHLFARVFYQAQQDIVKLADVLGHSNIETTRIYLLSSGREHQKIIDGLHLLC